MPDGATIDVKGLKELEEKMLLLTTVAGEKVMRSTLIFAAKPILQQVEANIQAIPGGSGALLKATRRVYLKPTATSTATGGGSRFSVAVTPKKSDRTAIALANLFYHRKKPVRGVFWGHFVEWGFTTSGGKKVPGRGVFSRAAMSKAIEAIELFSQRIRISIDRAMRKQNPE